MLLVTWHGPSSGTSAPSLCASALGMWFDQTLLVQVNMHVLMTKVWSYDRVRAFSQTLPLPPFPPWLGARARIVKVTNWGNAGVRLLKSRPIARALPASANAFV